MAKIFTSSASFGTYVPPTQDEENLELWRQVKLTCTKGMNDIQRGMFNTLELQSVGASSVILTAPPSTRVWLKSRYRNLLEQVWQDVKPGIRFVEINERTMLRPGKPKPRPVFKPLSNTANDRAERTKLALRLGIPVFLNAAF